MKKLFTALFALFLLGCGKGDDNLGKATVDVISQRDKVEAYDRAKEEIGKIGAERQDEMKELEGF